MSETGLSSQEGEQQDKPETEGEDFKASDKQVSPQFDLPQDVEEIIEALPVDKRDKVVAAIITSVTKSSFRSPIPPPDILRGYNEVIPNGAAEILEMAKQQQAHRIKMENRVVDKQQQQSGRGQILGFVLGLTGVISTVVMAYTGHDEVAGIFGTTTIVGLVGVFMYGKYVQEKDIEKKR